MKAVRLDVKPRAAHPRAKERLHAHTRYIYQQRAEFEPVGGRVVKEQGTVPLFLIQRLGLEAARLSAGNRRRVITRREIMAATERLKSRRNGGFPTDAA